MLNAFKLGAKYPVFTKQITAKKDPVSGKWMIPSFATKVKLIPEKAGHQRYFKDGAWHYVVDNTGTEYFLADGSKHTITELGEELPEGALLEDPPKPEPTFEERQALAIAQREAAYKQESDPLYMEWQYDKTDEAEQKWRDKVAEIKERYPLPTE
ncbi:hypothetical protein [Marinomonas sp. FW-1]|uniref:hypothetical protein n=1 Tax=Marinomonas sp. FW-1 TaxID=2071621 RepID=UPI001C2FF65E|nr:hypothetical protein [Marinomonas sp. FW-1]